jgi:hypothetical protein
VDTTFAPAHAREGDAAVRPVRRRRQGRSDWRGVELRAGRSRLRRRRGQRRRRRHLRRARGASRRSFIVFPREASFAQGAALGVPYATAYRALVQRAGARPSETVLVRRDRRVGVATV